MHEAETSSDRDRIFTRELLALLPQLRAFSRALSGERALADDLMQQTLLRAWRSRESYQLGTNMKAWLFTILRRQLYTARSADKRTTHLPLSEDIAVGHKAGQEDSVLLGDLNAAFHSLPDGQREVLILATVGGYKYEQISVLLDCEVGTVKSRLSRARTALQDMALHGVRGRGETAPSTAGETAAYLLAENARLSELRKEG